MVDVKVGSSVDPSQQPNQRKENCPVCNQQGRAVGQVTVKHLVTEDRRDAVQGDCYWICMNENCSVVYYNNENQTKFVQEQISVPIWFKKDANPKYACYCSKVTEEQVIEAVLKHNAKTVKEVNAVTGAMKNSNCIQNNPLGVCCHKVIREAIEKVLKMK